MIRCDSEEEREALKKLVWACYEVVAAQSHKLKKAVCELEKAYDALAEMKL